MPIYTVHVHEQCNRCWLKKKKKTLETSKHKTWTWSKLSLIVHLDARQHLCVCGFFFFHQRVWTVIALFMHMDLLYKRQIALFIYCSRDPQLLYLKKNIKNWSYGTIYTFKNYFVTVFSIFNKISCIQTDHKAQSLECHTSLFLSCLFGCSTSI